MFVMYLFLRKEKVKMSLHFKSTLNHVNTCTSTEWHSFI